MERLVDEGNSFVLKGSRGTCHLLEVAARINGRSVE